MGYYEQYCTEVEECLKKNDDILAHFKEDFNKKLEDLLNVNDKAYNGGSCQVF